MAKGIRVNLLAKELGVESKMILQKLKEEGLADQAPNHMSTLSLGLAESVREWFSSGAAAGGTAVETAPHVEVVTKPKTVRKTKKKSEGSSTDEAGTEVAVAEAPPAPAPAPSSKRLCVGPREDGRERPVAVREDATVAAVGRVARSLGNRRLYLDCE